MLSNNKRSTSLLQRALSAAIAASVKRRRPKRLCFLIACHSDSAKILNELVSELRLSLPGCRLVCATIDEVAKGLGKTARHYDAVFVVQDKPDWPLPEQLRQVLLRENWRYHLLAAEENGCELSSETEDLVHWQFKDWRQLQIQLGDLMYERARDVQQIPFGGSFDLRARS
ncbi:hypothetical protein BOX15_Mlig015026g3 [Macrostomum lignano]|uniref:SEFIR domain-containing protein n=2 Tax=Macrostomum lignano TaxID=282301 RepID=A0A1I8JI10_9PLAT|nr:hypothetical protein BOX15_Mlig015026g2 [Macrostomum lignano]PAA92066.1 hypothetical protein BOX15_Mlig015026g3 [Macrostomum lignano]